jgi:hypothetical protein
MNRFRILLLFIILFVGSKLSAQSVEVNASIDTARVLIGDQSKLTLSISYPQGLDIQIPTYKDTIITGIEIVEQTGFDTVNTKNGYVELKNILTITSFDSNLYYIPPFEVEFYNNDKVLDIAVSNSLSFHVLSIPLDPKNPNMLIDIKAIKETPFNMDEFVFYVKQYFPYILSLVLLIGLIVFVVLYFERKNANKIKAEPEKPKEPADVIAYRELENLKTSNLLKKGKVKDYHSLVSEIVRRYLENRYGILAMEETSSFIMKEMQQGKYTKLEEIVCLKDILSVSDLVKFAKYQPNDYENDTILKNAYQFVDNTKFVEEIQEVDQEAEEEEKEDNQEPKTEE